MDNGLQSFDPHLWGNAIATIQLEEYAKEENYPREIHNTLFLGYVSNWKYPSSTYKSRFHGVGFKNVNFDNKDFKDCLFDQCKFMNCQITFASIVSSTFRNCHFEDTPFKDEAIHDCDYHNCTFKKASFVGSMIRNSNIHDCNFISCETSNKVFDACFLKDNSFEDTELDFRAIQDNFGLSTSQITKRLIRENRSYPDNLPFDFSNMESLKNELNLGVIDLWKLKYYQEDSLMFYGDEMDNAFKVEFWMRGVQTSNNFVRFLVGFAEFVISEYLRGTCLHLLVVKLHGLTFQMFKELNKNQSMNNLLQAVSGVHVRTGQIISKTDSLFQIEAISSHRLHFRTDDGAQKNEIDEIVETVRKLSGNLDFEIVKRNSPVDIIFNAENINVVLSLVSFFVLSKTSVEIERIKSKKLSKNTKKMKPKKEKAKRDKNSFVLRFGMAKEKSSVEVLSISSSEVGNYSVFLSLKISTSLAKKIRKILFELIS